MVIANEILLKCVLPGEKDTMHDYYFITNEQLDTFDHSIGLFPVSYRLEILKNNKNEVVILRDDTDGVEYTISFISGWFKKWEGSSGYMGTCSRTKRLN